MKDKEIRTGVGKRQNEEQSLMGRATTIIERREDDQEE